MSNAPEKTLAPVAVFVCNRLDNTKEVIEALQNNYLAKETDVFVFSDGPGSEKKKESVNDVRRYLRTVTGFKSFNIIEREKNFYIERNIIEGVTELINKYGKVIVLEDDGVSAKNFLTFMNKALDFYQDKKRIMHIASFTFIKMPNNNRRTIIWHYTENTGGGWATWKDRWDKFQWFKTEKEILPLLSAEQKNKLELGGVLKCLNSLKLDPIPWDICWYIAIVRQNGLAVNSPGPLIKNNGLFNGTHFTSLNKLLGKNPFELELDTDENIIFEDKIVENVEAIELLKKFYRQTNNKILAKIIYSLARILSRLQALVILKK